MKDKTEQEIFQLLPCYKNDVLAMESWLEDMAAAGYMLKKFKWNGAVFVEREPVQVRYRLLLAPENKLFNMGEPTLQDNFIAKHGVNEWAYITSYGSLFVFLCRKTEISEPERDIINIMDKIVRNDCASMISCLITILTALAGLWLHTGLGMLLCITIGTWKYGGMIVSAFYFMWDNIANHCRLLKLRRTLKENTYEKQDDYSREVMQAKNKRNSIVWLAFMVILISSCSSAVAGLYSEQEEKPLRSFYDTLPFPMINNTVPDGAVQIVDLQDSTIRQWSDILVPVAMEVSQYTDCVDVKTGKNIGTDFLQITYFETQASWMAEQLAKDYQRFDTVLRFGIKARSHVVELSGLNMDYAAAYESWWDTIILAKNNKMIRICFYDYDYTVDEIARIYADYLLSEGSVTTL